MITSGSNPKVKQLVLLQKKKKLRDELGVFVIEGIRMFKEVPRERLKEVYTTESFYKKNKDLFEGIKSKIEFVSNEVFQKISETKTPQGILCVVKRKVYSLDAVVGEESTRIVVLEGLQDPGNVGTIIRTSEAAGVNAILLTKDSVDIYHPKTIRSTMGSLFRVPCIYVEDLMSSILYLKNNGFFIYASHLGGEVCYNDVKYSKKSVLLVGNEGNGLSEESSKGADTLIKIPMAGDVESLNAAVATTILMYEMYMQRRNEGCKME